MPATVYTLEAQQLPSCQGKATGQEKLQGDETRFLNAELGLTTISQLTVSAGAANSGQGARPTRRPPCPWPLLVFALLFHVVVCLELAGRNKYTLLTHPPPKHTHLWSLRQPLLHNAGFAGTLCLPEAPHSRSVQLQGTQPQTPPKLNIDQNLFQRAAAAQESKLPPKAWIKVLHGDEFGRSAYLERCLRLNPKLSPTPRAQGIAFSGVQALCRQINSRG